MWNILKSVPGMSSEEAQKFMDTKNFWEYVVLDVRGIAEYKEGHIPGSIHIPIDILNNCMEGFSKDIPIIVVCSVGGRSSVAVDMLKKYGCKQVYNLNGGIKGWKGLKTANVKELEYGIIEGVPNLEQAIALTWLVEDATREFYSQIVKQANDECAKWVFNEIEKDEIYHQRILENLYDTIFFQTKKQGFPYTILEDWAPDMTEGGRSVKALLKKLEGRSFDEIVNIALSIEAGALDAHIIMERKTTDKEAKEVFKKLAQMEKKHAEKIAKLIPIKG